MINLHHVSKIYPPEQTALAEVDLKVSEGDFMFLAGASGAGKSTLLKLLYGAEQATSGEVVVGGRNMTHMNASSRAALRRSICWSSGVRRGPGPWTRRWRRWRPGSRSAG